MKAKSFYLALSLLLSVSGFSVPSFAATYYSCQSGYNFQVNNNAARCYKPSTTVTANPLACGNVTIPGINQSVGHFLRRDYQGNADKCVGTFKVGPVTNTNALDLGCPSGYTLQVKSGADTCRKTIAASTKAPTQQVNR